MTAIRDEQEKALRVSLESFLKDRLQIVIEPKVVNSVVQKYLWYEDHTLIHTIREAARVTYTEAKRIFHCWVHSLPLSLVRRVGHS